MHPSKRNMVVDTDIIEELLNDGDDEGEDDENLMSGEYSRKSEYSKARIVERAVTIVLTMRAKEMKEGYWNNVVLKTGDIKKSYVEDSRKIFIGSVESLKCILSPEITNNEHTKKFIEEMEERKKEIFNEYSVKKIVVSKGEIKEIEGKNYIPEIDESFPIYFIDGGTRKIQYVPGLLNYNHRMYWNEMVKEYDLLFGELNNLIGSKDVNYFKQRASF